MKKLEPYLLIILATLIATFNVACELPTSHTHTYKWYPVKQATCQEEGQMEGICQECGLKEYTTIEVSSHEFSWTIEKEPSCSKEGLSVGYCVNCYTKKEKIINPLNHQYDANGICKDCGQIKSAIYLEDGQKLGYSFADMDKIANDKGFSSENLVSNYVKSGKNISLSVNKNNDVIINIDSITFSIGNIREDFVVEEGVTATISYVHYTKNNELYVIYVDGTRVLITSQFSNNIKIAINNQNELLIVSEDKRVSKYGTLPEILIDMDSSVLIYELSSNGSYYTLCGAVDRTITELVIPETHKGTPIKAINEKAFYNFKNLKTVTLNSNISHIEESAFASCLELEKIFIPLTVTYINRYAFYNCPKLTIYCEASQKPLAWNVNWNYFNCPVFWNSNEN